MNLREQLYKIFGGDAKDIQVQVRKSNAKRALYIAIGAVCINVFFLLHFYFNVNAGTPVEIKWRKSIILLHTVFICYHLALLALALYIKRTRQYDGLPAQILVSAFFLGLPIWGAAAVIIDQLVTTSIMSFFLTCAVCAMGMLMRPVLSILYYVFAYAVFYFGIALTQSNTVILLTS
ncbi:MAG TPA: hypothetical protein VHB48_13045, partial [Chitinophagaceae bacterium]|nr:hypothetical protein [Chitinophagaceae bacterium]